MHARAPWTYAQTFKSQLRRAVENNWRRGIPRALRKQVFFVRLDEHCGKVANSASLAGRNQLQPAVGSCGRHIVALLRPHPRNTTFHRTERCAHRRNHQSQHRQEGKHDCVCRPDPNWNRFVHPFIFTWHRWSRAFHSHLIAGAPNLKANRAINRRPRYVRQKASVARLLVVLKIHPAQPRQLWRRQPRAIDRQPNPIQKGL
jgi:hypothetical protein